MTQIKPIYSSLKMVPPKYHGGTLAIGNFDGVHRGHQVLLQHLLEGPGVPLLVTFEPHPREILGSGAWFRIWGPWDLRNYLRLQNPTVMLVEESFNSHFSQVTADLFLKQYVGIVQPRKIVVGYDFAFGKAREGTVTLLQTFCQQQKIELKIISPVEKEGVRISTTSIKELLKKSDLERATQELGHSVSLGGIVAHGLGKGKSIGVPTANIVLSFLPALALGVYAVEVEVVESATRWRGVANLGFAPTLHSSTQKFPHLEVHIFDFDQNLYDKELNVYFKSYLRTEKRFADLSSLQRQIASDIEEAKRRLV